MFCWVHIHSLCNHVTLYGLASPRLLHSLIDHIETSHSFKHGYSNGRWVVLYALVSPQWSHAWFRGRVRTILLLATKLYICVNKLGGSMSSVQLCNSLGRASAYSGHVDYTGWYNRVIKLWWQMLSICFWELTVDRGGCTMKTVFWFLISQSDFSISRCLWW